MMMMFGYCELVQCETILAGAESEWFRIWTLGGVGSCKNKVGAEGTVRRTEDSPSSASLTTDMLEAREVFPDFVTPPAAAFIPANILEAAGNIS